MLLTLTNPVESITHVTLAASEEDDPDDINSTAKVFNVSYTSEGVKLSIHTERWITYRHRYNYFYFFSISSSVCFFKEKVVLVPLRFSQ